jgi:hypothetical protein
VHVAAAIFTAFADRLRKPTSEGREKVGCVIAQAPTTHTHTHTQTHMQTDAHTLRQQGKSALACCSALPSRFKVNASSVSSSLGESPSSCVDSCADCSASPRVASSLHTESAACACESKCQLSCVWDARRCYIHRAQVVRGLLHTSGALGKCVQTRHGASTACHALVKARYGAGSRDILSTPNTGS